MNEKGNSIKPERLSIISALIIFNYALMPFIASPQIPLQFTILGFLVNLSFNYANLMVISAALFSAVGTYWLIYDHTGLERNRTAVHLLLPTLVSGALSIPLNVIEIGIAWWVVFALGSLLVILSLIAEYYSIDPNNSLFNFSRIILFPLALSVFLLLSISTRSAAFRLYIDFILLMVAFGLITTRLFFIYPVEQRTWKIGVSLLLFLHGIVICHYLPLKSISFGSILTGGVTILVGFAMTTSDDQPLTKRLLNTAIYAVPFLLIAILFI